MDQWHYDKGNECIEESYSSYSFYDGGNFFDIGAFNGIYSYLLAPKANNDYFVSFEPDSRFLNFISFSLENLSMHFQNIKFKLIQTPVGNGEYVNFNLPNIGTNGEIGHPCFFGDESKQEGVKSISLDKFITDTNIIPSLIKIDVEGAEFNVLNGAKELLSQYKPKIILEIHNNYLIQNFKIQPSEVINFIEKFGYKENLKAKNSKVDKILYFD
jgi:FkbM family methyltransferase